MAAGVVGPIKRPIISTGLKMASVMNRDLSGAAVLLNSVRNSKILVSAKVRGHPMFVVPALAGPPKGGTTSGDATMCSYLCSR